VALFTTTAELSGRITAARFAQLFDDDGDGVADSATVAQHQDLADDWVRVFLEGKGFTKAQIEAAPVVNNKMLRGAAADICVGFGGERKPEWRNERGEGLYDKELKRGKEMLAMLVKGELRIPEAGPRTNISGRLTAPEPPFVIASSSGNPKGPGGF